MHRKAFREMARDLKSRERLIDRKEAVVRWTEIGSKRTIRAQTEDFESTFAGRVFQL